MKIGIASDHAGFQLKGYLSRHLKDIDWIDFGCDSEDSVDYPDLVPALCGRLLDGDLDFGVLLCGTGIGMSITSNRFLGIRAALCHNNVAATMSRKHNDANILAMGARLTSQEDAISMLRLFISTPFDNGRHQRRIKKIDSVLSATS